MVADLAAVEVDALVFGVVVDEVPTRLGRLGVLEAAVLDLQIVEAHLHQKTIAHHVRIITRGSMGLACRWRLHSRIGRNGMARCWRTSMGDLPVLGRVMKAMCGDVALGMAST